MINSTSVNFDKYLSSKNTVDEKKSIAVPQNNTVNLSKTIIENDEFQSSKPEKSKKAKVALGVAILSAGALVLGNPKIWNGSLKRFLKENLEKAPKNGSIASKQKALKVQFKQENPIISGFANIMNNFTSFKDCFFMPAFKKIPGLNWLSKKSSDLYINTGINMTQKGYKKAQAAYSTLDNKALELAGDNKALKEKVQELVEKRNKQFSENLLGDKGLKRRSQETQGKFESFYKDTRDHFLTSIKNMFNKDKEVRKKGFEGFSKNFVAEELASKQKGVIQEELKTVKTSINKIDEELMSLFDDKQQVEALTSTREAAQKKLNKALHTESEDLVDKIRDVKVGCAPMDVSTIGLSAVGLGYYTAQAKTKEERTEVALTTGMPLVIGMTSSIIATMKMLAGSKALLFGTGMTILSNIVGKAALGIYKQNLPEQTLPQENQTQNA